MTKVK